jgi:hypothetical protein
MVLLLEVLGVLAVAAVVRAVTGGKSLRPGLTVVVLVAGAIVFWTSIWPDARDLVRGHSHDARLTPAQRLAVPGAQYGAQERVLAWADASLPPRARVFLECPQATNCSNGLANWIAYRLEPRVFTDYPQQAQWILFYNTPRSALASLPLTAVKQYAPGYVIGMVAA